ncbi:hypothetical protein AVEN_63547-1 [Araneus ventricosus]|uniref:Uncharacterized protein n=1 Tax=Araneus ventricosus TaxID=182803 RepID=A0A4Y2MRM6_ARAVE|nr:hypothetical protein AVEN_63547-1 [Araneus ventricosus]
MSSVHREALFSKRVISRFKKCGRIGKDFENMLKALRLSSETHQHVCVDSGDNNCDMGLSNHSWSLEMKAHTHNPLRTPTKELHVVQSRDRGGQGNSVLCSANTRPIHLCGHVLLRWIRISDRKCGGAPSCKGSCVCALRFNDHSCFLPSFLYHSCYREH